MEIVSIPSLQDPLCPSLPTSGAPRPARPSRFSSPSRFAVLPRWMRCRQGHGEGDRHHGRRRGRGDEGQVRSHLHGGV